MGDPTYFSVVGGANPHTRTRFGSRRRVNRELAIRQWAKLRDLLRDLGVHIVIVPADEKQPGLVYPANAGFMLDVDAPSRAQDKLFHLANLLPTRAGEIPWYRQALKEVGIATRSFDARFRHEGEADFFPAGDVYLFTHGRIEEQRFVPTLSFPPWKRVYGFRSDVRAEHVLVPLVAPKRVLTIELTRETHYHGDTVLCAFGPGRAFLLAWREGLAASAWEPLRVLFGGNLIPLSAEDAACYAANSFTLTRGGTSYLVMPDGVSDHLLGQIRERGVTPITVDVSEFLVKGGGSVKCMIGDLGVISDGG
jgi:N-dimethylarginine dimethylaminohydrolase